MTARAVEDRGLILSDAAAPTRSTTSVSVSNVTGHGACKAQIADFTLDDELAALLDEVFVNAVPVARWLLRLLEERGWTGWTKLERICTTSRPGLAEP